MSSAKHNSSMKYPVVEKKPINLEKHGDVRTDPYFWLKERENPQVISYLKAENAYTEIVLAPTKGLQEKLFTEMKSRVKEDESTYPYKRGDYYYQTRYEMGQQYPVYVRRFKSLTASEEILLDCNKEAQGQSYFSTTGPNMSFNEQIMAYGVDTVGRRFYSWKFKDLKSGQILPDSIENVTGNLVWAKDNKTVFYTRQDPDTLRSYQIYRYELGSKKPPVLVFEEKQETYSAHVYKTNYEKFIFILSGSTLSNEVRYIPIEKPTADFAVFQPRERTHEYVVVDDDQGFIILTNWEAKNFRVMRSEFGKTNKESWKEYIPHDEKVFIQDILPFKNFYALTTRFNGLTQLETVDKKTGKRTKIAFEDESYVVELNVNEEYNANKVRYSYESQRRPPTVYDYDVSARKSELLKAYQIPNYNPDLYMTKRVFVTARDGTKVPVSMLMKKDFAKNGKSPVLVYGYGSYGINIDPDFSANVVSLVDRGFVFALAHIRGGGEMGRAWTDQGRTLHKKNTFTDFIDCTEFLINEKYADPQAVFAMGGSAGGLLMGAVVNMRPDLYKGVVAQVPFVDVVTTMLDDSIPLTTGEYDEWGNPNEKAFYDYIKSYSPYDNVVARKYPNMLVTTGLHDSQVQYWEPAKWVAKLRDHNKADTVILLKTNMEAGHGGKSGRFERLHERALEYAFILSLLPSH